jgi:hypothetical protein
LVYHNENLASEASAKGVGLQHYPSSDESIDFHFVAVCLQTARYGGAKRKLEWFGRTCLHAHVYNQYVGPLFAFDNAIFQLISRQALILKS